MRVSEQSGLWGLQSVPQAEWETPKEGVCNGVGMDSCPTRK